MAVIVQVVILDKAQKTQQENREVFCHKKDPPCCVSTKKGYRLSPCQISSENVLAANL